MSHTATIELVGRQGPESSTVKLQPPPLSHRHLSHSSKVPQQESTSETILPSPVPSITGSEAARWNETPATLMKVFCCFYGLFLMGINDGAYGALIPYLESYYNLSYTAVSLVFLTPAVGYVAAALLNNVIHEKLGQRGVAIISPGCKIIAYAVVSAHPPFPVVAVILVFAGFAIGLADAAWNAYIGAMADANQLLGFMHAFYGVGATLSPVVATSLITKANWPWSSWYFLPLGAAVIELAVDTWAFWENDGQWYRASVATSTEARSDEAAGRSMLREILFHRPAARVTWICSLFLFGYMGVEVTLGGWIVTFMRRIRGAKPIASSIVATGFWLGITVGRLVLGFVTPRIGENLAITIYLVLTMTLQLIFWLVPSFLVSAIFVALEGFFLGPLFPAAVVATTKLLPKHLHVPVIGFAAAFGGGGAATFPFIVGAVSQATSVRAFQPIVVGMLAFILAVWLGLPKMRKRSD